MAVDAIQTNTNTNKGNRASYVKTGATGALCGYALKHILPLTPEEKDEKFLYDMFSHSAREAKEKAIEAIANAKSDTPAQQEFLKLVNFFNITSSTIKAYPEPMRSQLTDYLKQVNNAGRETKIIAKRAVVALTKEIRPTGTFVATGAIIAAASAFVYNVIGKISDK